MRSLLAVAAALAFFIPGLLKAQDAAGEQDAIIGVIQSQIAAFQADQAGKAFSYASPMIQGLFRDPETFLEMVRTGYAPVYRPRSVEFLDLLATEGTPTQRVLLIGPDGLAVVAHYFMQKQPDGSWKINGVQLLRGEDQTA